MTQIAQELDGLGFTLRSGHAEGADQAFEEGATKKQIFVPWQGFNGASVDNRTVWNGAYPATFRMAEQFHPAWDRCSWGARRLLARNVAILGGIFLIDPVEFVICWTKDGQATGGTGHALRVAHAADIPVFNLNIDGDLDRLVAKLEG